MARMALREIGQSYGKVGKCFLTPWKDTKEWLDCLDRKNILLALVSLGAIAAVQSQRCKWSKALVSDAFNDHSPDNLEDAVEDGGGEGDDKI